MKSYKAKTLIEGYKLGIEHASKILVAVPLEKAVPGNMIYFRNQLMQIKEEPIANRQFPDKFGRGSYTLCYYEWKADPLW